jgi:hypothetical protein
VVLLAPPDPSPVVVLVMPPDQPTSVATFFLRQPDLSLLYPYCTDHEPHGPTDARRAPPLLYPYRSEETALLYNTTIYTEEVHTIVVL